MTTGRPGSRPVRDAVASEGTPISVMSREYPAFASLAVKPAYGPNLDESGSGPI